MRGSSRTWTRALHLPCLCLHPPIFHSTYYWQPCSSSDSCDNLIQMLAALSYSSPKLRHTSNSPLGDLLPKEIAAR